MAAESVSVQVFVISGQSVQLDAEGVDLLSQRRWTLNARGYLVHRHGPHSELFHRTLMQPTSDQVVDHIDGNPLNNLRSNLRICTFAENLRNRKMAKHNSSGFKGIYFEARRNSWRAVIVADKTRHRLGSFKTPEEAHAAYCAAAIRLHKEFARFS